MKDFVNHSGGAIGSDSAWDEIGKEFGMINNKHYYYGQKTPKGNTLISEDEYEEGKEKVLLANKVLKRKPEMYMNLLARNWVQVKNSEAIFAIGEISNNLVKGGTGWAVQMAIDAGKPVYVFDQNMNKWFKWDDRIFSETYIPTLTKHFAGIGTRKITDVGNDAIREVYSKTEYYLMMNSTKEKSLSIPFGKYKDQEISVIAKNDIQYLLWILQNASNLPKDTIMAIEREIIKTKLKKK